MNKSFYRQLTQEFNLFNKWNSNLLNKHQFVVYPTDQNAAGVAFGLFLPSMVKQNRHALEHALHVQSLGINEMFDDEVFDYETRDNKMDEDAYEERIDLVSDLHQCLLEYLDQALNLTCAFQQNAIDVPKDGYHDSCANLFYIFQWYLNIREKLTGTELYELPMELDDRCSDMSINSLKEVMNAGLLDKDLGNKLIQQGEFVTTFFGNVFPLVATDPSIGLTSIVKACFNSNFKVPQGQYKNNGFAKAEFNDTLA